MLTLFSGEPAAVEALGEIVNTGGATGAPSRLAQLETEIQRPAAGTR